MILEQEMIYYPIIASSIRRIWLIFTCFPNEVMNDVITIVNYIKSHALCHRQFQAIFKKYDANCGELEYYYEVRWLSKGAVWAIFSTSLKQ